MLKSLMKSCFGVEDVLMRSSLWRSTNTIVKLLVRGVITLLVFRYYDKKYDMGFADSLFMATAITSVILFFYNAAIRSVLGGLVSFEVYYDTIFGNEKSLGGESYGVIGSFVHRMLMESIALATILLAYMLFRSQFDSDEIVILQNVTTFALSFPYLYGIYSIGRCVSFFYKAKHYAHNSDGASRFENHNKIELMLKVCHKAPDVICNSKGIVLLLLCVTWPLRLVLGNVAMLVLYFIMFLLDYAGWIVLVAGLLLAFVTAYRIEPTVLARAQDPYAVLLYWPAVAVLAAFAVPTIILFVYGCDIGVKVGAVREHSEAFLHGEV